MALQNYLQNMHDQHTLNHIQPTHGLFTIVEGYFDLVFVNRLVWSKLDHCRNVSLVDHTHPRPFLNFFVLVLCSTHFGANAAPGQELWEERLCSSTVGAGTCHFIAHFVVDCLIYDGTMPIARGRASMLSTRNAASSPAHLSSTDKLQSLRREYVSE